MHSMYCWLVVGTTLACGLHNVGYDWLNVGVWLVQRWLIAGSVLAYGWHNVE